MAASKYNEEKDNLLHQKDPRHPPGRRPDLSRAALKKVLMGSEDAPANGVDALSGPQVLKNQPDGPDHMNFVPTPEMVDYVVAGLACGKYIPGINRPSTLQSAADAARPVTDFIANTEAAIGNAGLSLADRAGIDTSWIGAAGTTVYNVTHGSALQFQPPNITTQDGSICTYAFPGMVAAIHGQNELLGIASDYIHRWLRQAPPGLDVFNGAWVDDQNQAYKNLAEYTYDHLSPAVYKGPDLGASYLAKWWDDTETIPYTNLWPKYENVYLDLVKTKFEPVLHSHLFHNGCSVNLVASKMMGRTVLAEKLVDDQGRDYVNPLTDDAGFTPLRVTTDYSAQGQDHVVNYSCPDGSDVYHLSRGIQQSLEIEMRDYLRGIFELYLFIYDHNKLPIARAKFDERANILLADFNSDMNINDATAKAAKDFDYLTDLFDPKKDKNILGAPDMEYANAMATALNNQAVKVLADWKGYGDFYTNMTFLSANSRPPGDNPAARGCGNATCGQ
jgi:hypothetical protein